MRLITRRDASLAVALIAATFIAFERPLRWTLDAVHDIEERYHLDLLPALTLLVVAFMLHAYRKRVEASGAIAELIDELSTARARVGELEQLTKVGEALGQPLDRQSLEQTLWRVLPTVVGGRECSVLTRMPGGYELLVRDSQMLRRRPHEWLEGLLAQVPVDDIPQAAKRGADFQDDICFPLVTGDLVVGALVVRRDAGLDDEVRRSIGAAASLLAVTMRNVHLLQDARLSSARDSLTGCFTRAHGLEVLQSELRRARRSGRPVSLIMLDLDDFKDINDRKGHLQGDAVLASLGTQLNHILRSTDVRVRWGGDEFLLILPDTPLLGAQQVADTLRREIAETARDEERSMFVTVSLGVTAAVPGELDPVALVARADEALYRAKRAGRNRYCVTAMPVAAAPAGALARTAS